MLNKEKLALPVFLLSLLLIPLVGFKFKSNSLLKMNIQKEKKESKLSQDYVDNLRALSKQLDEHKDEMEKLKDALPNDLDVSQVFYNIGRMASDANLILDGISFNSRRPNKGAGNGVQEAGISISLDGSYPNFKKFLSLLERSDRIIDVSDISFSKKKGSSFIFHLGAKIYYFR